MRFRAISIIALLLVGLFSGSGVRADFEYGQYTIFPAWGGPNSVAIADLNGDGRKDVVVAINWAPANDPGILVFQQNQLGQLGQPSRYLSRAPTGVRPSPSSVAIGDLNHDGKPDVVVGNRSYVEVFTQTQSGLLDPSSAIYTSPNSFEVVVADLNNDGRDDVVGVGPDGIDIFYQNTAGSLDPPVRYSALAVDPRVMSPVIADINNDGLKDIVIPGVFPNADFSKTYVIRVMLQTKDGGMQGPIEYPLDINDALYVLPAVGDVNGDGLNDVVIVASYINGGMDCKLYVFLQGAQGNLEYASSLTRYLAYDKSLASVALADVNKDGRNDIVIASESTVWVVFQGPSGAFLDPQTYSSPFADIHNAQSLAVDDLNGDGLPDIAVANYNYGLILYYQRPITPAIYSDQLPIDFGSVSVGTMAPRTVTFTNYGRSNLKVGRIALSANYGQFYIQNDLCSGKSIPPYSQCTVTVAFLPATNGYRKAYLTIPSDDPKRDNLQIPLFGNVPRKDFFYPWSARNTGSWPLTLAIGDLNGDGRNDIAMTTSSGGDNDNDFRLFVFLQDNSGHLLPPVKYPVSTSYGHIQGIDVGDLNNDGRADVVVANGEAGYEVFLQNSSGELSSPVVRSEHLAARAKIGDLNNDGLLDVVETGIAGSGLIAGTVMPEMRVFLQNSTGALDFSAGYYIPNFAVSMATGDVNGDGLADVVLVSSQWECPNISVFTQKLDGILSDPHYYCAEYGNPYGVAVGDMNGDGLQDIVFTYFYASKIGILLQKPDGTLEPEISYDSFHDPEAVRIADLNNDGKKDIIVLHGNQVDLRPTHVGVFLQDEDGALMPEEVYDVGYATLYDTDGLAVGDFNGDGLVDIAIANYNYGLILLYQKGSEPTPGWPLLTVTSQGAGRGMITSSPAGIDCGSTCSVSLKKNTRVTLTPTPEVGSVFTGWTGGCKGKGTCSVTMSEDITIGAIFDFGSCAYTISSKGKTLTHKGGTATIAIAATGYPYCPAPEIVNTTGWITYTATAFTRNRGSMKLFIPAWDSSVDRANEPGTVAIGGNAFTLTQKGKPCTHTLSPTSSDLLLAAGDTGSFTVMATPNDCAWTAAPDSYSSVWITIDPGEATGIGTGGIRYTVGPNAMGRTRSGKIVVTMDKKNKTYTVRQNK